MMQYVTLFVYLVCSFLYVSYLFTSAFSMVICFVSESFTFIFYMHVVVVAFSLNTCLFDFWLNPLIMSLFVYFIVHFLLSHPITRVLVYFIIHSFLYFLR